MYSKLIEKYRSLDDDAKNIIHTLALFPFGISMNEILDSVRKYYSISQKRTQEVIADCTKAGLVDQHSNYNLTYVLDNFMRVWIFPLIINADIKEKSTTISGYYYSYDNCEYLLHYISALLNKSRRLPECEIRLLSQGRFQLGALTAIFCQPAYDKFLPDISGRLIKLLYNELTIPTFKKLDNLEMLHPIDEKLKDNKSAELLCEQAKIIFKRGHFDQTFELVKKDEVPIAYFAKGAALLLDDAPTALDIFEKGMKKQRKTDPQTYIPLMPEAALFYLAAWVLKGQEEYLPFFRKIVDKTSKYYDETIKTLSLVCTCLSADVDRSDGAVAYLQRVEQKTEEVNLWKTIVLGFVGEELEPNLFPQTESIIRKAYVNGYSVAAYEAAFAFLKWTDSPAIREIYDDLAKKLNYAPVLSRIKPVETWEKQLNSYLSLDAVQLLVRKEEGNNKNRVAYRFFPERTGAQPILQSRQADGSWTPGRNIAMNTFKQGKVESMTEQDKRIAASEAGNYYSYELGRGALAEMTGHPHVYLKDSNIPVELIAFQPVLSIAKLRNGNYKLECDVTDTRNNVWVEKETNTRYKIYVLTPAQREIIAAVTKGKSIPEQGIEPLRKVLKHFSAYMNIQSDSPLMDENDAQARQVEPDSRIRVQLLPFGDGLKAELFVKPFGAHPPYCKPGRGGKVLMAYENGERLRVVRNMKEENKNNELLISEIQSIESLDTTDDLITFNDPINSLDLLEVLGRHQEIVLVEWPEGEQFKLRKAAGFEDLVLRVTSGTNWFEVEGELKIDEESVLSISALLELIKHGHGRFVELSNGEFLALSEQLKRRLSELGALSSDVKEESVKINRFASASLVDVFDDFENLKIDKAWREFRKRLKEIELSDIAVPVTLQAELRPYQETGYRWMLRLAEWGAGACLADDMGLGKTVQAIAVLLQRFQSGPAMVIAPVSVTPNWISEVRKFAPSLTVKTLNDGDRAETLASLKPGDLLITSYGLLLSEETALAAVQWGTVILDEAHAIKNYTTKTSKAAMSLQAGFRMILTGTPIQNHLGEVWNLFNFINPGLLGSLPHFTDTFIKPGAEARKHLKKLIAPFILRRTKTAVLDELPPKTEIVKKIELGNEERAFYEILRRKAIEKLAGDDGPQGAKHLKTLAEITRLRQACCNPALVEPGISIESAKLSAFLEIAGELKENGHRALVFSQFVTHLSIVRAALDKAGFTYQYLDGSTPTTKRETAIRKFQKGEGDLFLISLKAGGLGLNLTAADYVIHLDPWWNPAIEDQASDRAHRIGQTRPVTVYRLVAENTIEEKIIQLHNTKRDLADSLLEGSDQSAKLSLAELMALIKEG